MLLQEIIWVLQRSCVIVYLTLSSWCFLPWSYLLWMFSYRFKRRHHMFCFLVPFLVEKMGYHFLENCSRRGSADHYACYILIFDDGVVIFVFSYTLSWVFWSGTNLFLVSNLIFCRDGYFRFFWCLIFIFVWPFLV